MAHIEQQNPHIEQPRYAWQFNPFELADWDGPPDDCLDYKRQQKATNNADTCSDILEHKN